MRIDNFKTNKNNIKIIFEYSEIPNYIKYKMTGKSMPINAKTKFDELSYLILTYYGFDNNIHIGEMIVNKKLANETVDIFKELYKNKYPIEKVRLIDEYNGNDDLSMKDNNTSSFCYRTVAGTNRLSNHSKGMAIDINPLQNPHIKGNTISPIEGEKYIDRENIRKGMIIENDVAYNAFIKRGWKWGGHWSNPDYQHFEKVLY